MRAPVVFYNRSNEAAALLKPGDFDWKAIFAGVRWFHSGGIFAALSPTTSSTVVEAAQAAKAAGAIVSFDLNYREKIWNLSGGAYASEVLRAHCRQRRCSCRQRKDLQKGLGVPGPEVQSQSKLDSTAFFGMIDNVRKKFPHVTAVATTLREVHSTNRHSWSAVAWIDGEKCVAPVAESRRLRPRWRRGQFAGLFYGLLTGQPAQEAVKLGWAHGPC